MHCEFDYSPLNISSYALSCLPIVAQCLNWYFSDIHELIIVFFYKNGNILRFCDDLSFFFSIIIIIIIFFWGGGGLRDNKPCCVQQPR